MSSVVRRVVVPPGVMLQQVYRFWRYILIRILNTVRVCQHSRVLCSHPVVAQCFSLGGVARRHAAAAGLQVHDFLPRFQGLEAELW